MILADKIISERKKNGWSQEELAEKLGVTRQAVSKWEGAQTTPDLERLLLMSKVFGVSADYLLKDELETVEYIPETDTSSSSLRKVGMEEANQFLKVKKETAPKIAFATFLCVISPICLMVLGCASEQPDFWLTEDEAGGIGMIVLLIIVAAACAIYISCGAKTKDYIYLEKELIETEYGVSGMVKERKRQFEPQYTRYNILGTILCIMGVVPIFAAAMFTEKDFIAVVMVGLLLFIEGIGVSFFIIVGIQQASFNKLLQEEDYSIERKTRSSVVGIISTIYWLLVTAFFLVLLFFTEEEKYAGLIWPIAGVIYPAILAIVKLFNKK
ncbi:MAG: helix-turn-helix domain-containing protein [Lachnospiraceae bacterium]